MPARAYLNAVAGAVPDHDIHAPFIDWAETRITDDRRRTLFRRMAERSGIDHRWSIFPVTQGGGSPVAPGGFYDGDWPGTAARMAVYAEAAPALALDAIAKLSEKVALEGITHMVVASCTGFAAPGIDQIIARRLGLDMVERTLIGFMGCYAAVAALRTAYHIARSDRDARILVVTVELSSIHLQDTREIEPLLAMLQFGDGAAAALVSARPEGFALSHPFAATLPASAELIRWTIGDAGFAMHLSGAVPGRIAAALPMPAMRSAIFNGWPQESVTSWAVHAGGRSILDAVETGLELPQGALCASRDILARFGNMSSATLMFVLAQLLGRPDTGRGVALAFGPGLAAEGLHFEPAR